MTSIDQPLIDRMEEMIGDELPPICFRGIGQMRDGLRELREAEGNVVREIAHRLKGASSSLGLVALAQEFAAIEAEKDGRRPAGEWLARAKALVAEAEAWFSKRWPAR
ncbi:Hpt domain-containing protein [Haloferula sargassicola]|uniref:HPt domain-containing protein n=1 Tax=Haloferula sargassicola TaxID=490096 RepID=A0ABP9UQ48_9BACT